MIESQGLHPQQTTLNYLKKTCLTFGLISCALTATAQKPIPDLSKTFNSIVGDMPGCAVGVIHKDKLIYEHYTGLANIKYQVPVDEKTRFNIGSISKHITAAVFFQLESKGELKRSDTLNQFYPDGPKWFKNITLEHLLTHQSGMPDYLNDPSFSLQNLKRVSANMEIASNLLVGLPITNKAIVENVLFTLSQLSAPTFESGSDMSYSNTGYLLLADILNNYSDSNLDQLVSQYIFDPYDMTKTQFHDEHSSELKWIATGYIDPTDNNSAYTGLTDSLLSKGDGGVLSTIKDFSKWMIVLNQSTQLESKWNGFLIEPQLDGQNPANFLNYYNGLSVGDYKGTIYAHSGQSIDLMTSTFWVSPEHEIGYVQMCNSIFRGQPAMYKVFDFVEAYSTKDMMQ